MSTLLGFIATIATALAGSAAWIAYELRRAPVVPNDEPVELEEAA